MRFDKLSPAAMVAAIAAAAALTGCGKPPGPPPGAGPQGTPQVGFVVLQPQSVPLTTELPGRTAAFLVADVRPQVGGLIQSRPFREGSDVKAGQVLYQIDPATYRASVDNAQAALAKAEASLLTARLKAQRYKELAVIKAVAQQDYDDAAASLGQGEADVAAYRAQLQTQRINLAFTRVTSPISGRIGKSSVTPGALVTASQTAALATVQKLDPIYVDVTQPSTSLLRLRRAFESGALTKSGTDAAKVKLLLEDGSTYAQEGRLQFSDVTVDQNTGAVTVRAVFPNLKGELLPGMYVRAVLEEGSNPQALLVPQQGVTRNAAGKPTALVVGADNKIELRVLTTDRAIGDQWLVSAGLKAGDKVVVDGIQKARPGVEVKPVAMDRAALAAANGASSASAPGPDSGASASGVNSGASAPKN